jgi:hypothetical protein
MRKPSNSKSRKRTREDEDSDPPREIVLRTRAKRLAEHLKQARKAVPGRRRLAKLQVRALGVSVAELRAVSDRAFETTVAASRRRLRELKRRARAERRAAPRLLAQIENYFGPVRKIKD